MSYIIIESGSPSLRKAISKHLNVDESRILFGAGLDEVILMISRAVLTPGDKIVTSEATLDSTIIMLSSSQPRLFKFHLKRVGLI